MKQTHPYVSEMFLLNHYIMTITFNTSRCYLHCCTLWHLVYIVHMCYDMLPYICSKL